MNTFVVDEEKLRRSWDEKSGKWYFSIVDAIDLLTNSINPRNYWKVLKNRLKKEDFQLVTKCNQLKLKAKDGKYYLNDVADSETLLALIKHLPGVEETTFHFWFGPFLNITPQKLEENSPEGEGSVLVDLYQTDGHLYIEAMLSGVHPDDLSIAVEEKKVNIRGKRIIEKFVEDKHTIKSYLHQELHWIPFSRTIPLPFSVQKEKAEVSGSLGHLKIKLLKQN